MFIHFDIDENLGKILSGRKSDLYVAEETLSKIKDKEKITGISIKTQSRITKKVLSAFPKLKLIITRTVGVDHIDLQECKKRGIAVYHIPNYGAEHVAQHAAALMLAGARNIVKANTDVHKGNFDYSSFLGINLAGKTFGVVGTGRIGLEFIKIAKSLGMRIVAYDIFKNKKAARELGFSYVGLEKLLKMSDVVSLHIPSTKETKHILNAKRLGLIKTGAILVNTARGDLIDEKALLKNINKFHAVCLDVLENENKFSKKHPLLKFPNVIITPHIAFYSDEAIRIIANETEENMKRFKKGDKINRVV